MNGCRAELCRPFRPHDRGVISCVIWKMNPSTGNHRISGASSGSTHRLACLGSTPRTELPHPRNGFPRHSEETRIRTTTLPLAGPGMGCSSSGAANRKPPRNTAEARFTSITRMSSSSPKPEQSLWRGTANGLSIITCEGAQSPLPFDGVTVIRPKPASASVEVTRRHHDRFRAGVDVGLDHQGWRGLP